MLQVLSELSIVIIFTVFSRTLLDFKKKIDVHLTVGWKWTTWGCKETQTPQQQLCLPGQPHVMHQLFELVFIHLL